MKKSVNLTDRAIGPVVPVSYKGLARRRNKANGSEAVSVVDFLSEDQRGQTIQFSITNSATEDKVFAVFPGRLNTVEEIYRYAGVQVDAIAKEGEIKDASDAKIAVCSSKTLNLAQGWFKDHPTRMCKLKLQTDNEAQFGKELGLSTYALGKTTGTKTLRPIEFVSPSQNIKTLCEIEVSMQLDDATVMFIEVGAGRTIDCSLQIVTELNTANALNDMIEKLED